MIEDEHFIKQAKIVIGYLKKQEAMTKNLMNGRFRLQIIKEGHFNGTIMNENLMFNRQAKVFFRFLMNLASELSKEDFMALIREIAEELYRIGLLVHRLIRPIQSTLLILTW
ncbi:MAG: hypothetical protein IJ534_01935 [Bacteroidaceae bacterium]|nr:hypothetical protein [Bacteroidaceae bacterium]